MKNSGVKFPDQPIIMSGGETIFAANRIVRFLLDRAMVDLNQLNEIDYLFTQAEWDQFYQLIGYSTAGFYELSNVSDEARTRCTIAIQTLKKSKGSA